MLTAAIVGQVTNTTGRCVGALYLYLYLRYSFGGAQKYLQRPSTLSPSKATHISKLHRGLSPVSCLFSAFNPFPSIELCRRFAASPVRTSSQFVGHWLVGGIDWMRMLFFLSPLSCSLSSLTARRSFLSCALAAYLFCARGKNRRRARKKYVPSRPVIEA